MNVERKDLVVLVADRNMEAVASGLLSRVPSLNVRPIESVMYVHPEHDPGCRIHCHDFLRPFANLFRNALVMFDQDGCGRKDSSAFDLETEAERQLSKAGWGDRAAVIVLDPELEIWVWSNSPHVARCLGWKGSYQEIIDHLVDRGLWETGQDKPTRPKDAVRMLLRRARKPRSSSIYEDMARTVGLRQCRDRAFAKFKALLQGWFPQESETP